MSVKEKQSINVLNYNDNVVVISTRDTSYAIDPCNDGVPSKLPFTFHEIETINSNGNAFSSGILRFEEAEEAELYEALRITNWKDILKNSEIADIILSPTYDGLVKIISVKNSSVFERIRGIYTRLKNDERNDISNRIERIITTRYRELIGGKSKTEIVLTQKDSEKPMPVNVGEMKAENEALKVQMEELKAMMATLLEKKEPTPPAKPATTEHPAKKPPKAK